MTITKSNKYMKQRYYILTHYSSYKGGVNNLQVSRIVPVGSAPGFVKQFTSEKEQTSIRAERWAKKHTLSLVG